MDRMKYTLILMVIAMTSFPDYAKGASANVQQEIDKIAEKLSKIEAPNAAMVGGLLEQIQAHCPNRTIDEQIMTRMQQCMQSKFNNTELEEDIREAIPQGKLDEVFHDVCLKWPVAKDCMHHLIDVIQDCWSQGDKVTRVMDSMVKFFCGDKNDGSRIALFFADGGMRCMEAKGDEVKECITRRTKNVPKSPLNTTQEDICSSLTEIHNCAHRGFRKCDDPTPENLVTSMMKEVAISVGCPRIPDPPSHRRSPSSAKALQSGFGTIIGLLLYLSV